MKSLPVYCKAKKKIPVKYNLERAMVLCCINAMRTSQPVDIMSGSQHKRDCAIIANISGF